MSRIDTRSGQAVLMLAHVAGMIDMVALPLWVGTLMQHYRFSAPAAGVIVTVFLAAVVVASLALAPRFLALSRRAVVAAGFGLAAMAFAFVSLQAQGPESIQVMLAAHGVAGLGVGSALSMTHGCIGRSRNPHRLFALVNATLGVFAIAFLAGVPPLIVQFGASVLFEVFAATMAVAAVITVSAFPQVDAEPVPSHVGAAASAAAARPRPIIWLVIGTVVCLTLNQSMVFSFVERIGSARGFSSAQVNGVLIALGLCNLFPGPLAALLQRRLLPTQVGMAGPVLQAALALMLSGSLAFAAYAAAGVFYVSIVIFTHTFLFGLLSRLDVSGRAVAGTPAMMMLGSCLGPALGGAVVHALGYQGLGWLACLISALALVMMAKARATLRETATPAKAVVGVVL